MIKKAADFFGGLNFKAKLMLIIMITSACSLLITVGAVVIWENMQAEKQLAADLGVIAELIANRSSAAITFQDQALAAENLLPLKDRKSVFAAALYNENGEKLAEYLSDQNAMYFKFQFRGHASSFRFTSEWLEIRRPVIIQGHTVGSLYMYSGLDELRRMRRSLLILGAAVFLIGALIAFFISSKLQGLVSRPIIELSRVMKRVTQSSDYSLKAEIVSGDETGVLIDVFNEMLALINSQKIAASKLISELRQSTDKLNLILDTIPQAIYLKDASGQYLGCNSSFAAIAGLENPKMVNGKTDNDFPWSDTAAEFMNDTRQLVTGNLDRVKKIAQITRAGGGMIWIEKTELPVSAEDGGIIIMGVIDDITERRTNEDKIQQLNAELEERVKKRTEQLENANNELEAFSYSVSHDLRAPLRHTSGFVELLKKRCSDELSEKALHYLNTISQSVHEMGVLIDNLLQFSRTGRLEMHASEVNMSHLLAEVRGVFAHEYAERNVEWSIAKLPTVNCDRQLIRIVWINLLGNALKYTRTRVTAIIEIGFALHDNEYAFFIRDNGVGFDMQYADKLFGVFQRLHNINEFEGTGIGLANVRRIINRHGGRVWAEAEPDKGAVFYFSLPKPKEIIS